MPLNREKKLLQLGKIVRIFVCVCGSDVHYARYILLNMDVQ